MSILSTIRAAFTGKPEKRAMSAESELALLTAGFSGGSHRHLVPVSGPQHALRNSVVHSCIKLLSETISTLPLRLIDRTTKRDAIDHPVYRLLQTPNTDQTAVEWLQMTLANLLSHGNAYNEMEVERGRITALYPMAAARTAAMRKDGDTVYQFVPLNGKPVTVAGENVMHHRLFGMDDITGTSPLWCAEKAICLSLTQEQLLIDHFSSGVSPDIIVTLPPEKVLDRLEEIGADGLLADRKTIQAQIEQAKTRRHLYLPAGYSTTPYAANLQQGQLQESRDFQALELARIWRVPPSKLGVLSKQTTGQTESERLAFFTDTIRPLLVLFESRLERDLLTDADRQRYQIKFNFRALLRGDPASQTTLYVQGYQIGLWTRNELRELEDLPPFEDDASNQPMTPVNLMTEQVGGAVQLTNPADGGIPERKKRSLSPVRQRSLDARKTASRIARPLFHDAVSRIVRKEKATVLKDARSILGSRSVTNLEDRLKSLYDGELKEFIERNLHQPVETLCRAIREAIEEELGTTFADADARKMVREYVRIWTRDYTASSLFQLLSLIEDAETEADILPTIEQRLDEWEEKRADKEETEQTNRGREVFSKGLYLIAGITSLVWVTSGDECPICEPFDGLVFSTNNTPPCPLHRGCNCSTTPAN